MALGVILLFASLLMSPLVGLLGGILAVVSAVGWFREVLPSEKHVDVPTDEDVSYSASTVKVGKFLVSSEQRAMLPLQTFSITSGIVGGIVGGIAMVIPAEIYGILRYHSLWYVVNLLGGAGVGDWVNPTVAQMSHFNLGAFITANIIQGVTTLLVGVLYGALLPALPKRPILLGGLVAPVLWTGLLYTVLGLINPFMRDRIDWPCFVASQVMFGVVAGLVVTKLGSTKNLSQMPLAVRMGVEASGLHYHEHEDHSSNAGGDR